MWHLYISEAAQLNLILQMLWAKIGAKIFWLVTFSLLLVSRGERRVELGVVLKQNQSEIDLLIAHLLFQHFSQLIMQNATQELQYVSITEMKLLHL